MTSNGCLQIPLFGVIVIAIKRPFGGYMTRAPRPNRSRARRPAPTLLQRI